MIRLSIRLLVVMHIMVLFYFITKIAGKDKIHHVWEFGILMALIFVHLILLNIQLYIFVISYFKNRKECS